jgi:hypothetical protein
MCQFNGTISAMALAKTRHPRPKRAGKNSTLGERTAASTHAVLAGIFGGRTVIKLVGIFAAIVLVAGGVFWYRQLYSNPERVFWGMVGNNLSTPSITKEISQKGVSASNTEQTQLAFSPSPVVRDLKDVSTQNANLTSRIKIESIGTPTDTYQHYVLIRQTNASGQSQHDYSKVYSLWLKNSGKPARENQLFNNVIYSALLFGNMPATQRSSMIEYIKSAYRVDFNSVSKDSVDGRKIYTYNVKLNLRNYAKAINYYAKTLGLPEAAQVKESNYKTTDEVALKFSVDVLSRQARTVQYAANGSTEKYITYGIVPGFKLPEETVSYDTLQNAVQAAAKK